MGFVFAAGVVYLVGVAVNWSAGHDEKASLSWPVAAVKAVVAKFKGEVKPSIGNDADN